MATKRLNTREREILRRVYGPVVEQKINTVRIKQEFREPCKNLDIAADITKKRLE
jgi:hypothetical protein